MDRGAWWVQSIGLQRVGQNWSNVAQNNCSPNSRMAVSLLTRVTSAVLTKTKVQHLMTIKWLFLAHTITQWSVPMSREFSFLWFHYAKGHMVLGFQEKSWRKEDHWGHHYHYEPVIELGHVSFIASKQFYWNWEMQFLVWYPGDNSTNLQWMLINW